MTVASTRPLQVGAGDVAFELVVDRLLALVADIDQLLVVITGNSGNNILDGRRVRTR
ncbi:MAG: hypothetical protein WDN06_09555 [Asticcacaulis sp.]